MADDDMKRRDKTTDDDEASDEETESTAARRAGKNAAVGTDDPHDDDDEDDEDEEDDDEEDDNEDDDNEDDEDDEDEEDDQDAHAATAPSGAGEPGIAADDDWIPDWAPWVVLIAIVAAGLAGLLGFLSPERPAAGAAAAAAAAAPSTSEQPAKPRRRKTVQQRSERSDAGPQRVSARHLLVQYQGSLRAKADIARTKEQAKRRAQQALAKARKGEDFVKLVKEYSDESGAATRGGMLGKFTRRQMVKPFSDAAFALKPGEISGIVETRFGYHVIKRLE